MDSLTPELEARYSAELELFAAALRDDYPVRVVEAGDELPVPTMLVDLGADEDGRDRTMAVGFLPLGDDELPSTQLLQFYVRLPFDVADDQRDEVLQAASLLNAAIAIGHFAVRDGEAYYRYVLAAPAGDVVDGGMLGDLVPLLHFHQLHFGDHLEGVATEEVAVQALPRLLAAELG